MEDTPKAPTTGDPKLDELVRASFTEVIEVVRQVLADRHPEMATDYSQEWVDTTCALIATQTWPIFGAFFVKSVTLGAAGEINILGDD